MSPPFILHSIELSNGKKTIPNMPLLEKTQKCQAVLRTLNLFFKEADRPNVRVADLGCLEGGYSVAIARQGYDMVLLMWFFAVDCSTTWTNLLSF